MENPWNALDNHPNSSEYVEHLAIKKEQCDEEENVIHTELDPLYDCKYDVNEPPEEFDTSYMEPITELIEDIKCEEEDDSEFVTCEIKKNLRKVTKITKKGKKPKKPLQLKFRKCEKCCEIFPNLVKFNRHKREVHKEGSISLLKREQPMEIKSEKDNSEFVSSENKESPKKLNIKKEQGEKPFNPRNLKTHKCIYCEERYTNMRKLEQHKLDVHKGTIHLLRHHLKGGGVHQNLITRRAVSK